MNKHCFDKAQQPSNDAILKVFKIYRNKPHPALRNRLVEMNLGLARTVAHQISSSTIEPYEDLEQVAMLGLIAAVERFDPHIGLQFSTYAIPTIKGKLLQHLRDKVGTIRIPQSLQDLQILKTKTEQKLLKQLGRIPTETEIIAAMEIDNDRYLKCKTAFIDRYPISLNTPVINSFNSQLILEETIASEEKVLPTTEYKPRLAMSTSLSEKYANILKSVFSESETINSSKFNSCAKKQIRKAVEVALKNGQASTDNATSANTTRGDIKPDHFLASAPVEEFVITQE